MNAAQRYLSEYIMYGGIPTPRTLVIEHLKRAGVKEPSPAYFRYMEGAVVDIADYGAAPLEPLWDELRGETVSVH